MKNLKLQKTTIDFVKIYMANKIKASKNTTLFACLLKCRFRSYGPLNVTRWQSLCWVYNFCATICNFHYKL